MSTDELQKRVNEVFTDAFGRTPLKERLDDIAKEAQELCRATDIINMKEEAGDLLATLFQLLNECEWRAKERVEATLHKIERRKLQYKSLGRKLKVALLGGAFDPIHVGHIQLAKFVLDTSQTFDEVWLVPCYEHMFAKEMIAAEHRLAMCEFAAAEDGRIRVCDYEIKNKLRGETYHFVKRLLEEDFAKDECNFSLIIGQDNANGFESWVNYELLEKMIRFVVVPRKGTEVDPEVQWYFKQPHIYLAGDDSPIADISSTNVRQIFKAYTLLDRRKALEVFLHPDVYAYAREHNLYPTDPRIPFNKGNG